MRLYHIRLLAIVLTCSALMATTLPAFAGDTVRRGAIGAITLDNVVVPDDANCTLNGTRVEGNIFVQTRATLTANGVAVDGNIQTEGHTSVTVGPNSTVGGNIQIEQGGSARVEQVRIDGDLQLFQNNGQFLLSGNIIGGNLQANQNQGTGLTIEGNRIDGNLQCQANNPAPVGGNNTADDMEDQCENLSSPGFQARQYLPAVRLR